MEQLSEAQGCTPGSWHSKIRSVSRVVGFLFCSPVQLGLGEGGRGRAGEVRLKRESVYILIGSEF